MQERMQGNQQSVHAFEERSSVLRSFKEGKPLELQQVKRLLGEFPSDPDLLVVRSFLKHELRRVNIRGIERRIERRHAELSDRKKSNLVLQSLYLRSLNNATTDKGAEMRNPQLTPMRFRQRARRLFEHVRSRT